MSSSLAIDGRCHVILKIKFNKGPRVAREPSREILLRAPKTTLGEPLGARFGGSLILNFVFKMTWLCRLFSIHGTGILLLRNGRFI